MYRQEDGDPENFKGKALIYAQVNLEISHPWMSLYITGSISDLVSKVKEYLPEDIKSLKLSFDKIRHKGQAPYTMWVSSFESREALLESTLAQEDIFNVGSHPTQAIALTVLKTYAKDYYFATYLGQRSRGRVARSLPPRMLSEAELIKNYISPLVEAVRISKNKRDVTKLQNDLLNLKTLNSGVSKDIDELATIIFDKNNPYKSKLIDLHVKRMCAINSERFEQAIEITNKINNLSNNKQKR